MKITISHFGKPKTDSVLVLLNNYLKLISRFQKIEVDYLSFHNKGLTEKKIIEGVIGKYKNNKIYLLAERGKEVSTSSWVKGYENDLQSGKDVVFVVGPAEGWGDVAKDEEGRREIAKLFPAQLEFLSLSKLTMQHDIAALVLYEQIYRVVSIKNNLPYHKD